MPSRTRHISMLAVAALLAFGVGALRPSSSAPDRTGSSPAGPEGGALRAPTARAAGSAAPVPVSVSPAAGTPDASPQTQISFLGASPSSAAQIAVTGSRSGRHGGRLKPYAAALGASFLPDRPFARGERVHVRVRRGAGLAKGVDLSFTVAVPVKAPRAPRRAAAGAAPAGPIRAGDPHRSRPDVDPAAVKLTVKRPTAGGDIFVAPVFTGARSGRRPVQRGPMILDSKSQVVWFRPLPNQHAAMNFRPQLYLGAPALTWWQGVVNPLGFGQGEDVVFDASYREIARVRGGNGYRPDLHEFVITPEGTAWFTVYSPVRADLSPIGGPRHGAVLDSLVQEIDLATGLVMFEWHGLGHISLRESYARSLRGGMLDFVHLNSIQVHKDRLLISARNTWALYEVSTRSGRIRWRLGGKRSSFRLARGAHFAYQHDAHLYPDGRVSLFDNGAAPPVRQLSRALTLKLDTRRRTAVPVHQYERSPLLAGSQGSAQTLPNGDLFVGWGSEPYFSEFSRSGKLVLNGRLPQPFASYRAFRFPWTGRPATRPAVAARRGGAGHVTVSASWNGSTDVASWQVLAGAEPNSLRPIQQAPRGIFETKIRVLTAQPYVAMRALDSAGQPLGTSRVLRP